MCWCYIITFDMTLFSQAKKNSQHYPCTMTAIAFMVFVLLFLLSTLAHADHLVAHSVDAEPQECYICHQGLDTSNNSVELVVNSISSYRVKCQKITPTPANHHYFVYPQLRAPPKFQ